jgi:ElaB/YqjD/DUF883 family membrane-anchored ribosome-binding protein
MCRKKTLTDIMQRELLKGETKLAKDQLRKLQDNHDLIVSQQRSSYTDERTELDNRVRELHDKLAQVQKKYLIQT